MKLIGLILLGLVSQVVGLTVPGHTAYLEPDAGGARVSGRDGGVVRWNDEGTKVLWFGEIKQAGKLRCGVEVRSKSSRKTKLKLTVGGDSRVEPVGRGGVVDFGLFEIEEAGYVRFELERTGGEAVDVLGLELGGEVLQGAHFNLKERRNAASVHLAYPLPAGSEDVEAFYCEMTGVEEPLWTYYMACGWHRGYFGMQVNSPTERRIIFSVWDSGNEGIDRDKVADEDRVTLMGKGEDVYSGSFGNEGTGGHSHLKFAWKTGERQRFLVTAEAVGEKHTVFAGYYFRPDLEEWMLISSWKAPKEGR
ncbi:MAG: DUF3472 domain-containing protein, partial [Verrucomicrobiales bacterium]|nr:DUF3472 domain-containing protein [Verrucomicrobiales bacterium]